MKLIICILLLSLSCCEKKVVISRPIVESNIKEDIRCENCGRKGFKLYPVIYKSEISCIDASAGRIHWLCFDCKDEYEADINFSKMQEDDEINMREN